MSGQPQPETNVLRAAWCACAVLMLALPQAASAGPLSRGLRPGDELWLVDSRGAALRPHADGEQPALAVSRYDASGRWIKSSVDELLAGDAPLPTVVWVHGNRVDGLLARFRGLSMYRRLVAHAPAGQPLRMIVWSWPAAQIRGPLVDVRVKAARTDPSGYHLAWLLDRLDPATPLGLVGFSYGARIITGALHLLDGGNLGRYRLAERRTTESRSAHVVLWASALHSHWLHPGQYHGQALRQSERVLLLNNSCDSALRRYRFLDPCSRPSALGYTGMAPPAGVGKKLAQRDACCQIGGVHSECAFYGSTAVMRWTWEGLAVGAATAGPALAVAAENAPASPQ